MADVNKYHTSVVLMHDSAAKHATVEALPTLIEQLLADGDALLPIDETTEPVQHISADSVED
jgi:peptidoglycan/xylan/chitin deacetylase (PgdA/CDA1 family)